MKTIHTASRSLTLSLAMLAVAASVDAQQITNVGILPGGTMSQCSATSADGRVVVGISFGEFGVTSDRSFRIVGNGAAQDIGILPGATDIWASSVSGDGATTIGLAFTPTGLRSFRSQNGAFEDIGVLPGAPYGAEAYGVNYDGSVVVGTGSSPIADFRAFRWTRQTGMVDLGALPGGTYSFGSAVSASGNVVVGTSSVPGNEVAFRWTAQSGMRALDSLDPNFSSGAFTVSANGAFAAGYSGSTAVRWNPAGQVQELGILPGGAFSTAYAISANGQIVAGTSEDANGGISAYVWAQMLGMADLNELLPRLGVDLSGWDLDYTTGMSADGRTMVGLGMFQGESRGWIVRLPAPGPGAIWWYLRSLCRG
jgi:probable HAF family extracellular repeat protein